MMHQSRGPQACPQRKVTCTRSLSSGTPFTTAVTEPGHIGDAVLDGRGFAGEARSGVVAADGAAGTKSGGPGFYNPEVRCP